MLEALRSSVNTWECDQMGHMNVRHYFARGSQALATLAMHLGLGPARLREEQLALRPVDQHVRFHHELRPGVPFAMKVGVLAASEERLRVYQELRSVANDRLSATLVSEIELRSMKDDTRRAFPAAFLAGIPPLVVSTLPEAALPRGVTVDTPEDPPSYESPLAKRLVGAFLGPVLPEDCDQDGRMLESMFMARISDGIGHFFRVIREGLRPDGIGGAALEYRYVYRERPRMGDIIEVRSGLTGLGPKTLHLGHVIWNRETGRVAATSEAVAVSFDLATRKAVAIPDDAREAMQRHLVTGFRA